MPCILSGAFTSVPVYEIACVHVNRAVACHELGAYRAVEYFQVPAVNQLLISEAVCRLCVAIAKSSCAAHTSGIRTVPPGGSTIYKVISHRHGIDTGITVNAAFYGSFVGNLHGPDPTLTRPRSDAS